MAGALAGMFLCDNGARVVRIGAPESEAERQAPAYAAWDRGKESVFLDLPEALGALAGSDDGSSTAGGRALDALEALADDVDVVLESFAPSSPYQQLVDYRRLAKSNPRLVHCSITAYGKCGPLRDEPAHDDMVMARFGIMTRVPAGRRDPVHVIHPVPSVGAGLLGALGIAAALFDRERTGVGRKVETSLMGGALLFLPKATGERFQPASRFANYGGAFYTLYECADGEWIQLACIHGGFVDIAIAVMGIAETLVQPRFGDGTTPMTEEMSSEVREVVAAAFKTKTSDEWLELLVAADVPCARAGTVEEALDDPQIKFNKSVIEIDDPVLGRSLQMGLPIRMSRTPGRIKGPRPVPGADTDAVLSTVSPGVGSARTSGPPQVSKLEPPLSGIRVLELSNVIAGPAMGKLLADLGADVVKLEPPGGEISRPVGLSFSLSNNANKRSVVIDTHAAEGTSAVHRLASKADVLVSNLRQGALERMGLSSDDLKSLNPSIVESRITAFGWDGPYQRRPGLDPLAQAMIGLLREQGGRDNPPTFLGHIAPSDYAAGAMGALGVVMALYVRERTGRGQRIDTNLLDGSIVVSSEAFNRYDGRPPRRIADHNQLGLSPLHRAFKTRDGWLYLDAEANGGWNALYRALGSNLGRDADSRFVCAAERERHADELSRYLERVFKTADSDTWLHRLEDVGVLCAPVVDTDDDVFFRDAHAITAGKIVEHDHPVLGRMRHSDGMLDFGDTRAVVGRPVPLLGQHTEEVLAEAGYSQEEVADMVRAGAVALEDPRAG